MSDSAQDQNQVVTGGIVAPEGWQVVTEAEGDDIELILREPDDPDDPEAFRANLVVTMSPQIGIPFADWQNGTDELLSQILPDYLPIDLERLFLHDNEGGRRLAHYRNAEGQVLTMEQWFALIDGDGHTLTFTVDTRRYDAMADMFAEIAGDWEPVIQQREEDA